MATTIDYTPPETDLNIYRGNSWSLGTSANPNQYLAAGVGVNCTGGTIKAQIRAAQDPSSSKYADIVVTWIDITTGKYILSMTAATTSAFTWSQAYWDVTFTDGNTPPNVVTFTRGTVTNLFDVSN